MLNTSSDSRTPIKKSLTFSGSRRPFLSSRSTSGRTGCGRQIILDNTSSQDSYDDDQSTPSTNSSPYSSVRLMDRHMLDTEWNKPATNTYLHHNHSRSSSSASASTSGSGVYSPNSRRQHATHNHHVDPPGHRSNGLQSDISPMARQMLNNSTSNTHVHSACNSSKNGTPSHRTYSPHRTHTVTPQKRNGDISEDSGIHMNEGCHHGSRDYNVEDNVLASSSVEHNSKEHEELLRLVHLQKDKLEKQHSSINELTSGGPIGKINTLFSFDLETFYDMDGKGIVV